MGNNGIRDAMLLFLTTLVGLVVKWEINSRWYFTWVTLTYTVNYYYSKMWLTIKFSQSNRTENIIVGSLWLLCYTCILFLSFINFISLIRHVLQEQYTFLYYMKNFWSGKSIFLYRFEDGVRCMVCKRYSLCYKKVLTRINYLKYYVTMIYKYVHYYRRKYFNVKTVYFIKYTRSKFMLVLCLLLLSHLMYLQSTGPQNSSRLSYFVAFEWSLINSPLMV